MFVFEPIFQILNATGVRYVVVGGLATLLHGYGRLTADVDLAVDLAPEEVSKVIRALVENGFRPQVPVSPDAFADPAVRDTWNVREVSPDPGGLARYPIKAVILVAFVLLLVQAVSEIVRQVAVLRGAVPEEDVPSAGGLPGGMA